MKTFILAAMLALTATSGALVAAQPVAAAPEDILIPTGR
jgi:hypothetical protein